MHLWIMEGSATGNRASIAAMTTSPERTMPVRAESGKSEAQDHPPTAVAATSEAAPRESASIPRVWSGEWCNTRVVMVEGETEENEEEEEENGGQPDTEDDPEQTDGAADTEAELQSTGSLDFPPAPLSRSKWMRRNSSSPPHDMSKTPPSLDEIKTWHFDVLSYEKEALIPSFASVLAYYDIPTKFNVDLDTVNQFSAYVMERHNPEAAYHNWYHGVSCMHMTFLILTLGGADAYLTDADIFAVLFGALVHDVDHAGHNNDFEVKTATERAIKYGNDAVLENHSVAITYEEILTREGCDIFEGMKQDGRDEERQLILEAAKDYVLWTDPARHGTLLQSLSKIHEEAHGSGGGSNVEGEEVKQESTPVPLWNKDDADSRTLLCRMIIHAADISNPISPDFIVARDWCSRISTEFAQQASQESELGLEVTPFMDGLNDEYRVAKQQIEFYKWMAVPFFKMVCKMLPAAAIVEKWVLDNKKKYVDIVAKIDQYREEAQDGKAEE